MPRPKIRVVFRDNAASASIDGVNLPCVTRVDSEAMPGGLMRASVHFAAVDVEYVHEEQSNAESP